MATLFDKKQAAEALGISTVSVDRLRQEGKLPYRKIGHLVRFIPEDIENFISKSVGTPWTPKARGKA
jgi:excisionase family DNA binding protein